MVCCVYDGWNGDRKPLSKTYFDDFYYCEGKFDMEVQCMKRSNGFNELSLVLLKRLKFMNWNAWRRLCNI